MKYPIEDCIGARLRGLSRAVDSIYRRHLKPYDITENQLSILMVIYKSKNIEQIEIARYLNLEKSSLSRNLERLLKKQLIIKEGAVNRPQISLTRSGVEQIEQLLPIWEQCMDEVYQLLGATSMHAFNEFEKGFK